MLKTTFIVPAAALLALAFAMPAVAQTSTTGDNLLIKRVELEKGMNLPQRGLSMAQVEKTWGAPQRKLSPRGGDSARHPQINRWEYSNFIVYFERSHVIHSVLNTPAGNNTDPSSVN